MSEITWLHLSDMHFRATKQHQWNEDIVLQKLLRDVEGCIDDFGVAPDLILVSGDVAYSGEAAEYDLAVDFFDDLLKATGLLKERLFVVPGNHDVYRPAVSPLSRTAIAALNSRKMLNGWLGHAPDLMLLLQKFDNYRDFVQGYLGDDAPCAHNYDERNYYVRTLELAGLRVAVLGLNSALLACDDEDRNRLALGERQVRQAIEESKDADVRIALLHHPFDWLYDFDQDDVESLLVDHCDLILRGHKHRTSLHTHITPDGRAEVVAAGCCYEGREQRNSYNFARFDVRSREGTIYLRAWSDWGGGLWAKDTRTYKNAPDGELPFSLDGYLYAKRPGGDSFQQVRTQLSQHTERALRQIQTLIPGIANTFPREEVVRVEEQLGAGMPVLLAGGAGTGKSGIGLRLARSAQEQNEVVLYLDARSVGHIQNEAGLRNHFDLASPLHTALELAGRYSGCRFIIDQLDNIAGSKSATLLLDLAVDCACLEGVQVIMISRKQEAHEVRLLERLTSKGFVELTSHPLSHNQAREALCQLGIQEPSDDLVELARNFLNLQLLGKIIEDQSGFGICAVMDEVDLWEQYRRALLDRESTVETAERIISEAVKLAREALNSQDCCFCLDYPRSYEQRRLISWDVIVCDERICRFRHEKLQDFLCAWDAVQRHIMPSALLDEIGDVYRIRNVLLWMDRMYARTSHELHGRFLREVFSV